jgi:hypothetical protein
MTITPSNQNIASNQQGFAAFTVTLILMIVLSLIVLGFAANARREQASALNDQLSTAAYYAAESGVNDAYNVIKQDEIHDIPIVAQSNCGAGGTTYGNTSSGGTSTEDSAGTIGYSCLIVNPSPQSLEYSPLSDGQGQVIPLFGQTASGVATAISKISLSWEDHTQQGAVNYGTCPDTTYSFPPQSSNTPVSAYATTCEAGVLQIDLFPDTTAAFSSLATSTSTVFLQPVRNTSATESNNTYTVMNGAVLPAECSSTHAYGAEYDCDETLSLPSAGQYYMRITPFYSDASVSITAAGGASGAQLDLTGAQALVDSTGKATDVLKRIQERICISDYCTSATPLGAIQSTIGVCKEFTTRPGVSGGLGAGNVAC